MHDDVLGLGATVVASLQTTADALQGVRSPAEPDPPGEAVPDVARRCEDVAFTLLARQQPAAGDLRSLLVAIKVLHEIERASRLTSHVIRSARLSPELSPTIARLLTAMAREARVMLEGALRAYAERDSLRAEALEVFDDRMDELHRRLLDELFTVALDAEAAVELALTGRYLERIADHAVIIGDRVRYLVTGELGPSGRR